MYTIMKKIVNLIICHGIYHVQYENLEIVNRYQRCLICPTHSNILDPFFIFPKTEHLFIIAKAEIFKNKWIGKLFNHYQVFPIKREQQDISGVRTMIELFEKNKQIKLLLFPEGGILKKEQRRKKIKKGAIYLAGTLEIPIIPVTITENPKLFSKVTVSFKEPKIIKKEEIQEKEKQMELAQELLKTLYEETN